MALPISQRGETLVEFRRHQRRRLLDQLAPGSTDQQPLTATILVIALALQQAALLETIEQTGKRRRSEADATAEHAGGHPCLAGQHLQHHQLHGRQPTEASQTLGMHLPRLLQAPQSLEQGHLEGHDR